LPQDWPIHDNSSKANFSQASTLRTTRHLEAADMFRIVLALVALMPPAARDNGQWENQPA